MTIKEYNQISPSAKNVAILLNAMSKKTCLISVKPEVKPVGFPKLLS